MKSKSYKSKGSTSLFTSKRKGYSSGGSLPGWVASIIITVIIIIVVIIILRQKGIIHM